VITDIVMPEKEGLALRDTHPPEKIIAISGAGPQGGRDYPAVARLMGAAKVLPTGPSTAWERPRAGRAGRWLLPAKPSGEASVTRGWRGISCVAQK
jgi:hypothetical protein